MSDKECKCAACVLEKSIDKAIEVLGHMDKNVNNSSVLIALARCAGKIINKFPAKLQKSVGDIFIDIMAEQLKDDKPDNVVPLNVNPKHSDDTPPPEMETFMKDVVDKLRKAGLPIGDVVYMGKIGDKS